MAFVIDTHCPVILANCLADKVPKDSALEMACFNHLIFSGNTFIQGPLTPSAVIKNPTKMREVSGINMHFSKFSHHPRSSKVFNVNSLWSVMHIACAISRKSSTNGDMRMLLSLRKMTMGRTTL